MVLIGRRQLRSNNSWMHNLEPLAGGGNECSAQVHPDDAARHALAARQSRPLTRTVPVALFGATIWL